MSKKYHSLPDNNRYSPILGDKLRAIRLAHNLTQAQLLELVRPDIDSKRSRSFVAQWESGRREPVRPWLIRYADIAQVELDALIRDDRQLPARITKAAGKNVSVKRSRRKAGNSTKRDFSKKQVSGDKIKNTHQPKIKHTITRTIAVYSNEPGSGKTVTAAQLALRSVISGKKVLLVDTGDDGGVGQTASYFCRYFNNSKGSRLEKGFYDFLCGDQQNAVWELRENLYLSRGGFDLHRLDEELVKSDGDIFTKAFEKFNASIDGGLDLIIFDMPSAWNIRNKHTLRFVEEIIIPFNLSAGSPDQLSELFYKQFASLDRGKNEKSVAKGSDGERADKADRLFKQIYILPNRPDDRCRAGRSEMNRLLGIFSNPCTPESNSSFLKYGNIKICEHIPYSHEVKSEYAGERSISWYREDELIPDIYGTLLNEIEAVKV